MSTKRTVFTSITPLPRDISREAAIAFLHNHREMIDLNPLVTERHVISAPPHAPPEERACVWYSITDKINLPGGLGNSAVAYTCAFHDLPQGIQTHCYAPLGVNLREKWTIGGTLPGEPPEPMELGLGAPREGLYIREDVDLRCNVVMAGFVKKTIKKSHGVLVEALAAKARLVSGHHPQNKHRLMAKPLPARPSSWQGSREGLPPLPAGFQMPLPASRPYPPHGAQEVDPATQYASYSPVSHHLEQHRHQQLRQPLPPLPQIRHHQPQSAHPDMAELQ